ncbi:DMT family transporter [Chthonobacter albigriseus]|uniref:DMT family transporter n=1 Tax=Chthonobacter albigriseus TaxID=1683161 RepID=UPI0015EFB769|nr:DMT family transporter [Chthonobacter albigriseus]
MSTVLEAGVAPDERAARKGIAIMLAGIVLFAFMNAVVKELAAVFPVNQIVFFRGLIGLLPLGVLMAMNRVRPTLTIRHAASHVSHAIFMTATLLLSYTAFGLLPLAEVTAIFFLLPVLVALMSAAFLREKISLRLWMAVTGGFLGVLLIARPTGISGGIGVLFGMAGAFAGAISMFQQRTLMRNNDTLEIVFWFMVMSSLMTLPTLAFAWVQPTLEQWVLLLVMGIISSVGQYMIVLPLRYAPASRLAPLHYTNLLGGLIIGYLWFHEVPDAMMLAGCAVVIGATALVLTAKAPAPAPAVIDAVEPLEPEPPQP